MPQPRMALAPLATTQSVLIHAETVRGVAPEMPKKFETARK